MKCTLRNLLHQLAAIGAVGLLAAATVNAQNTATWNGGAGNWNDATGWSGGATPDNGGTTYDVEIDGGAAGNSSVFLNQDATIDNLFISFGDSLTIGNGFTLETVGGTVTTNGTLTIDPSFANSFLIVSDGTMLNGTGSIRLNDDGAVLTSNNDGDSFAIGANLTVEGFGQIGQDRSTFVNNGTIEANSAAGIALVIDAGTGGVDNNSLMRATDGGVLRLNDGEIDNATGVIEATDASFVEFNGGSIDGGILTSSGTGAFRMLNGKTGGLNGNITNNATVNISGSFANTILTIGNGTNLNGSGRIQLTDDSSIVESENDLESFTNGSSHTIAGYGQVGRNKSTIVNNGMIDADHAVGIALIVDPGTGGLTNNAMMKASNGGTLVLAGGLFDNTNGTIVAEAASIVEFRGGVITNGILESSGAGKFDMFNGQTGGLAGNVTNNAEVNVSASFANTVLTIADATSLGGSGRIQLNSGNSIVESAVDGESFTNEATHTIAGFGQLGRNKSTIINNGTIDANDVAGGSLVVDSGSGGVTNNAVMKASNGGRLVLQDGAIDNSVGTIDAGDGSIVEFRGGVVAGGTLTSSGTGVFDMFNSQSGGISGNITNDANIHVSGSFANTILTLADNTNLNGTGSIELNNGNSILESAVDGESFVNGANHAIVGNGQVGRNKSTIVNNGNIEAIDNAAVLTIDPGSGGLTNAGTMLSSNGGTLRLRDGGYDNTSGIIEVANASFIDIEGAVIAGGVLSSSGTGVFRVLNAQSAGLAGSVTNNAQFEISPSFANSVLTMADGTVVHGSGTIAMKDEGAIITTSLAADTFTNGSGHTIRGFGIVGNGNANVINMGALIADNVVNLTLNPDSFVNQGTVQTLGGNLNIQSGSYTQTSGKTLLDGGAITSNVLLDLQGGSLEGSGVVDGIVQLDGTLAAGVMTMSLVGNGGAAGELEIDTLTLMSNAVSMFEIGGLIQGSQYDVVSVEDTLDLDGNLDIAFFDGFEATVLSTDVFTIMDAMLLTGTFDNVLNGDILETADGAGSFQVHYGLGSSFDTNSVVLSNFTSSAIPEPGSSFVILVTGLIGLSLRRCGSSRSKS